MKVEIEDCDDSIELVEHVIRNVSYSNPDGPYSQDNYQARINFNGNEKDRCVSLEISYYSPEGEFLGLDKEMDFKESDGSNPVPISVPINIPEGAETARVRIYNDSHSLGFFSISGRIATVLGLMLLAVWVFREFIAL